MRQSGQKYEQDFGPFEDDYRSFDTSEEGARGPLILTLAMGVLLIFAAIIWNTYKQGIRPDPAGLPVIMADATPYKSRPEEPGGRVAPDLERRIYDQLDGNERNDRDLVLQGGPPIELRPGQEAEIDEVSGIPREAIRQMEAFEADSAQSGAVTAEALPEPIVPPTPTEVEIVRAEPTLPVPEQFQVPSVFASDGPYLIQVGALRSQAAADAAWDEITSAEELLFSGATKRIQRADLGAKGVFYRVRAGAFETRAEASAFCDTLKSRGRACIVVSG
ncbi:MAG: SPOR domain-containing protein [Pseudomonadota bacterium]